MRRWCLAAAAAAAGWLLATPVLADLDVADYAANAGVASVAEQERLTRRIVAEQEEEAERMRAQADREAAQMAAERLQREARPYRERLTDARCTRCHVAQTYLTRRHTWLGWTLVTLRMKYLNGAREMSEAERVEIGAYLAEQLPMAPSQAVKEYLAMGLAAVGGPLAAAWIVAGLRRRYGKRRSGMIAGHGGK